MTERKYIFSGTHIGHNHVKKDKDCEDYSGKCDGKDIKIIAVADGHGSDNYPRTKSGSRFAVESAIKCVQDFHIKHQNVEYTQDKNWNSALNELTKEILSLWEKMVFSDYRAIPFSEEELSKVAEKYKVMYCEEKNIYKAYGSTLIVAAKTDNFCFGIQIGDGKLVLVDRNDNFFQPIPEDVNCFSNVTTSLCDRDALDEFRTFISFDIPTAIFIGTDGIDNSYPNVDDFYGLYKSIINIYSDTSINNPNKEIDDYLPILTKKGSGDDVSIAGIISIAPESEKLKDVSPNYDENLKSSVSESDELYIVSVTEVNETELVNNSEININTIL